MKALDGAEKSNQALALRTGRKTIDVWLVATTGFLDGTELADLAAPVPLPVPATAVISTDSIFITFLKLRLEYVQIGQFNAR